VKREDIGIKNEKAFQLVQEGGELYNRGKYQEALARLSEAERQSSLPEDKLRIADILSKAGLALSEKKVFSAALSYNDLSSEINRSLDNKTGLVNNYSYIGKIYTDMGKYEEGIEYFERALEIQKELNDKAGIAHNLNNVANLYSYLGNYQESINLLTQALQLSEEARDSTQTAKTLINLAAIDFRLRNYKRSIENLNRAYKIADEAREENLKAEALNLTGVVYRQQGDYSKALNNYLKALKINKKHGTKAEIVTNLSIIGELYKEMGEYDKALSYLLESLEISRESKDKLMIAVNLNYIGEVKFRQARYIESLELFSSSLGEFQELGFKDRIARNFNDIGYLIGEMKDFESAIDSFDKAIAIFKTLGDREWIRVSLFGRGLYSEEKGDLPSAEKDYKEAIDVFESIREDVAGGEEAEQLFSDVNVKIYENLVSLLLRLGKKEEALEYIERSRSKTLRDTLLRSGITSFDDRTRGLLDRFDKLSRKEASINHELVKERTKSLPNLEKIDNLVKTLAETREEFRRVTSELKTEHPDIYKLLSIQPGTFLDLEKNRRLPQDTIFLEYFITDKETYIFLIGGKDLIVKSVSIKKEELNDLVALFRELIDQNRSIPTNGWRDDGSENYRNNIKPLKDISTLLYHFLIEPIEGEIRRVDTVAIIPFGSLHYLPFHALAKEGRDGGIEFFIEEKKLVYLVSTSTNYLDVILGNGNKKREVGSVVAFGNPDLGEPDLALPYSEEEVLTIKKTFPNATIFLDKDATKDNFKSTWGGHEIIHVAAHGLIQEEPSILLAPLGSGSLTLSDITGLPPARNTHLIVLSACDAAVVRNNGESPTGAELNSIALAFSMVGTPSVIATLWRLNDRATYELMASFYTNLKKGKGFDYEALRKAQVEMLKRTDRYGQPFYWAPFILLGEWE
jgi:CHAT domain-containing protein/tetratricopeptide (TPR) repeat protein